MKGFLHATDAVIASLILILFLSAVFPAPKHYNWEKMHLEKEGKDLLFSLDKIGVLGDVVAKNDPSSFDAIISALSPNLNYFIKISNIPKKSIIIGNVVGNKNTFIANTSYGSWNGTGLPSSENNKYRNGTIFGVKFVLSDGITNKIEDYTRVNFDFNNNKKFNDTFEGPYEFNSVFKCEKKFGPPNSLCNGTYYEIGPISKKLVLFNASYSVMLGKNLKAIKSNYMTFYFSINTLNLQYEGISNQDILVIKTDLNKLNNFSTTLMSFLSNGGSIIEIKNLTVSDLNNSLQKLFGFKNLNYSTYGSGNSENVFWKDNDPENPSFYVAKYFYGFPIEITNFNLDFNLSKSLLYNSHWNISGITSNNDFYLTSNILLSGKYYNILLVNNSVKYDGVYFSENNNFYNSTRYKKNDIIILGNNSYVINKINPLQLLPQKNYYFRDFFAGKISGRLGILKRKNYFYNTSSEDIVISLNKNTNSPPPGVIKSNCNISKFPYKIGEFSLNGKNYKVALTNYEVGGGNCDPDYEYACFDLNNNGKFNDIVNRTKENNYQQGSIISIDNSNYKIIMKADKNKVLLENQQDNSVKTININKNVVNNSGTIVQIPNIKLGQDDFSLIRAIIMYLATKKQTLKRNFLGSNAVGVRYIGTLNNTVYIPYIIDSAWWYL